jgi:hypothetical protein
VSKVTESLVSLWETQDPDLLFDGLALHFKNHGRWYWRDVADEGLRVCNMMFAADAEKHSPLDSLITNIAAAAAEGVFAAIAAAVGVKSSELECAVSRWYDDQDIATPAIGLERLRQMLPRNADPSWEHVALGRLHHERIVHGYHDTLLQVTAAPKPDIDGLDPSDITGDDAGWTWSHAVGHSADYELPVVMNSVGQAIAKAGYRVTGHGFDATCEWLSFDDAVAIRAPLATEFAPHADDQPLADNISPREPLDALLTGSDVPLEVAALEVA